MEKICIWCRKGLPKVTFCRKAHIFPQSLGGTRICQNVCDDCNLYFGSKQDGSTSVEIALKEPLNVSRIFLLSQLKKKSIPRFKSEYFDYNLKTHIIRPKFKYRLINEFQLAFTKQFKRGLYKIFLEERSESVGDALDSRFDFIREFARFGLGQCPVLYCQPSIPAVFVSEIDLREPVIRFTKSSDEIMNQFGFYSYFFIGHTIALSTIRHYELTIENYVKYLLTDEKQTYKEIRQIQSITDLDFLFSFAFNSK